MKSLSFSATIQIYNRNPYIHITKDQAREIKPDWKKPLPVLVQINGTSQKPWSINMMPMGTGDFYLYLHGAVRKASKTKVGDTVQVKVRFDQTYHSGPLHPMPSWFEAALAKNEQAKKNWDALIPSRKKEVLRYFSRLKSSEVQMRNTEKAIHVLSGNSGRFMARSWENGS